MKIARVHGGLLNRMWRFDTDDGSFAVKQLNRDRDWTYRHDDTFRFERAAFEAGVPMPEPIAANETVLVHRWVDGDRVPVDRPVTVDLAREVGALLARIHALEVEWTHVSVEDPMPTEEVWRDLADRAADQPWGAALAHLVPTLGAIGAFVDANGQPPPIVLTHRDVGQKNLLVRDGRPILLDWETTGKMPLAAELGSTALTLATGHTLDTLDPAVFRATVAGYVDGGGMLPELGTHWFADHLSGWTWFLRWNVERCLAGAEPASGPSLAVSHDTVRRGLAVVPAVFARMEELAALTSIG
ncbi:MAG TPA: phosphotransferase [Acidimicrobiales bacterium]|nr:phosphotransferase [Acidimicrobiales bacterium]